jgi:SAM-dependent methyltransferase
MHFDAHAEIYDRARPPYPPWLWTRLRRFGLGPGARVLELGAGSGQATGELLRLGAAVTAVEPGPALAERLRRRWPEVRVLVGTAESASLPAGAFDLVVAATAVHWFDLDVVLPKVHGALVAGGRFAVWRTVFGDPSVPITPFRRRVAAITAIRGDRPARPGPVELDVDGWVDRLAAGGLFVPVAVEQCRWEIDRSAEQIRDLFTTFSDWTDEEAEEAARAADELGGTVTEHYITPLIVLDRVAGG